jgi:hypothetical protein
MRPSSIDLLQYLGFGFPYISRLNISHHSPASQGSEKRSTFHPCQASVDLGKLSTLAPKLPSTALFLTTLSLDLLLIVDLHS